MKSSDDPISQNVIDREDIDLLHAEFLEVMAKEEKKRKVAEP
jgi:hypothetical protein